MSNNTLNNSENLDNSNILDECFLRFLIALQTLSFVFLSLLLLIIADEDCQITLSLIDDEDYQITLSLFMFVNLCLTTFNFFVLSSYFIKILKKYKIEGIEYFCILSFMIVIFFVMGLIILNVFDKVIFVINYIISSYIIFSYLYKVFIDKQGLEIKIIRAISNLIDKVYLALRSLVRKIRLIVLLKVRKIRGNIFLKVLLFNAVAIILSVIFIILIYLS